MGRRDNTEFDGKCLMGSGHLGDLGGKILLKGIGRKQDVSVRNRLN
jgi:hypothetical protein